MATISNSLEKENISNTIYSCEYCEKTYKDRTGIWRHKKKCSSDPKNKIPENIVGDKTIEDKIDTLFQMVHEIQKKQEMWKVDTTLMLGTTVLPEISRLASDNLKIAKAIKTIQDRI
jgi:hypothetical protein